jgi:hypothetical protein
MHFNNILKILIGTIIIRLKNDKQHILVRFLTKETISLLSKASGSTLGARPGSYTM